MIFGENAREGGKLDDIAFDYHYGMEAEQYSYYRIPKALFTDDRFKRLSTDSKLLYGLLLDRMGLSIKNKWLDKQNRVYIYFSVDEAMAQMNCASEKATKLFAELDSKKGIGLIERVRQGQGKPSRIYVKRFISREPARLSVIENQDNGQTNNQIFENRKSGFSETNEQEFRFPKGNNTEINKKEFNKSNQSIYLGEQSSANIIQGYRTQLKNRLEYDFLIKDQPVEIIDEMIDLMTEVLCIPSDYMKIGQKEILTALVKERFLKLNSEHIRYILDAMADNPKEIRNIKSYLLEALFNAPATKNIYYQAKVNHDFYGQ